MKVGLNLFFVPYRSLTDPFFQQNQQSMSINLLDTEFMQEAIALARRGMILNIGGPFGAIVVHQGSIIGHGMNRVTSHNDPTAHAEIVAIREACAHLESYHLTECTIYSTCEPCPMCLGAIYWARPARLVYAANRNDAAGAGFDDEYIYQEIQLLPGDRHLLTESMGRELALPLFEEWDAKKDKQMY